MGLGVGFVEVDETEVERLGAAVLVVVLVVVGFTVALDGALLLLELATELMRPSSLVIVTRSHARSHARAEWLAAGSMG